MQLRVLTEEDIQRIHQATLQILAQTGIWFHDSPEATELLEKNGCKVNNGRVFFPEQLVEENLSKLPDRNTIRFVNTVTGFGDDITLKQGESHFCSIGTPYYIYDFEKKTQRDCVLEDVYDKFLILNHLDSFEHDFCSLIIHEERHGGCVPPKYDSPRECMIFIRRYVSDRIGRQLRRVHMYFVPQHTPEEERLQTLALMVLQGREKTQDVLKKIHTPGMYFNPISPLQYHPDEARNIIKIAQNGHPHRWLILSPEIMMGATGPVTLAGTLVQQNAEVLAGTVLAQLAQPGTTVIYGCVSAPMDLRSTDISQGHFETGLLNAAVVQLADHYGMPSRISPGNTNSKKPDAQAAVQTALGIYFGKAAGGNLITTGLLDATLMISLEHLVVVNELIKQVCNVTSGIRTDAEALAREVIEQHGHPSPGYISSNHTLEHMKRDIYYSDFAGRVKSAYEDWYEKAHRQVKSILQRRPLDESRDKETLTKLKAVEARLKEDGQTWRTGQDDWWEFYVQDFC